MGMARLPWIVAGPRSGTSSPAQAASLPYSLVAAGLGLLTAMASPAQVLTSQYDNARSGANLRETVLTPANVNARQFGKTFSLHVDGDVYAQPLFVPNVTIPGKGTHDVLYVATEHDSVYAFDADGREEQPLWHVSFLTSGASTVPARDANCPFIDPEIGVTPTPVIDPSTGTLYVLARTKESEGLLKGSRYAHRLHALAITTGAEKFGGPVEIATNGFDGLRELPRSALLLTAGQIYLTWASSCDVGPYHGWVMAYDASTLRQSAVWNTSPNDRQSGIWQSDMGPAADDTGAVYVATGNGKFDAASGGHDYGDSLLKLTLKGNGFAVRDYFTPFDEKRMADDDLDLGSGGPTLVPPHFVVIGGKEGVLYLLDRNHMRIDRPGSARKELQSMRPGGGIYSAAAYWNEHLYLTSGHDLSDVPLRAGQFSDQPVVKATRKFSNQAGSPAISANGSADGIVWVIETKEWNGENRPSILHAYDAADMTREIYNSEMNSARDRAGLTLRFTMPTVANGRVYIGTKGEVNVYGLLR